MPTIYVKITQSPSGSILNIELIDQYPDETKFGETIVQIYKQDYGLDLTYTPTDWS